MKLGKIAAWVGGVVVALLGGASMWFWFTPVGLNNYVNKITVELALASPQALTQIGIIDDTLLDFHSGKLDDQTAAFEKRTLERLRKARAGLDRYGPDRLEGQELLTWKITAWLPGQPDFRGHRRCAAVPHRRPCDQERTQRQALPVAPQ
jgi:hypothetical protein